MSGRYVVEPWWSRHAVYDLAVTRGEPVALFDHRHDAERHAARLNTPAQPKPQQAALFDEDAA
jgi:hypothetical protein